MSLPPNLLVLVASQLSGLLFPDGPAPFLIAPNLRRLADHALRFATCYAAAPRPVPAQAGLLSARLPARAGVPAPDARLAPDMPTFAHHLRRAGYRTALAGSFPVLGPPTSHGFAPAPIPPAQSDHAQPGLAETSDALAQDDETTFRATAALYAFAAENRAPHSPQPPWCLTVSFAQPAPPFLARRRFWDLYPDLPAPPESSAAVQAARRAHFANISCIDARIGQLFDVLEATGQEAAVVFLSDCGGLPGGAEPPPAGAFREAALRVPLMIAAPNLAPGLVTDPVSTLDLAPTLLALATGAAETSGPSQDGQSLLPWAKDGALRPMVAIEDAGPDGQSPAIALREGAWKFIRRLSGGQEEEALFDLAGDPEERRNLVTDPRASAIAAHFRKAAETRWNLPAMAEQLHDSATRRALIAAAEAMSAP